MTGTLLNTLTVAAGSLVGLALGKRLAERYKKTVQQALGLAVLYFGMTMALEEGGNAILTIGSVVLGGLIGEMMGIEQRLASFAAWLKARIKSSSPNFVEGFVTASVMYLTGPMIILGCLEDGLTGGISILSIKSLFDGVASIILASSLGLGVLFSAASVLVVQGALTLGASYLVFLREPVILTALTTTGGVIILGIGINLLDLKKIPVGNLLPALVLAVIGAMIF
jgi:uncharacterized membrane protein YqgA involved in biofilm formation